MVPKHSQNHCIHTTSAAGAFSPSTTTATTGSAILSHAVASSAAAIAARDWDPCAFSTPLRGPSAGTAPRHGAATRTSLFATTSSSLSSLEHRPHEDGSHSLVHTVQSIGPTILLGIATAVLYRSVLRHPNSNLTHQSVTYMLLLAVQVAIQPKLSQWTVLRSDDKVTVALMEEMVKTTVAAVLWRAQSAKARSLGMSNWSLSSSLVVAGLPAALYAAQGVLTYTSLQRLDAVTFNGLSQLKTVSAAIFCYLILGTTQSPQQVAAIALLLASSLLFQFQQQQQRSPRPATTKVSDAAATASPRTLPTVRFRPNVESLTGASACLMATAISGLAGALSQRGVQRAVGATRHGRDPFLYCGEVSLYSALCLLISSIVKSWKGGKRRPTELRDPNDAAKSSAALASSRSIRWTLWIPVTVKAMGGIATVLVHKHAGSVPKGFALVLGLVLSGMLEPDSLSLPKLAGTALVLLSSWMHFTSSS